MGTKYTTNAVASYNASPPSDAGAATEENRVTWAKTKTKLSDPLKTTIEAIDADLVEAFDVGPVSKSVDYTTVAGDNGKTISCTAALTVTLLDAATAAVGYTVNISNQSTGNVTVGRATSGNTINGTAANVTITRGNAMTLRVNTAANGYEVINTSLKDIAGLAKTDGNIIVGDGTNWVAESDTTARTSLGAAGTADANTFTQNQTVTSTSDGAVGPIVLLYQNSTSPAVDDAVGVLSFDGRNSTPARITYGSERVLIVDPTAGSEDGRFAWATYVAGTSAFRMYLGAGLYSANATGGDKGVGTANFSAVYDDNVLLTCGPVELMSTGAVDLEKWDSLVPGDRKHEVMRSFAKMRDEGFDPRDPANFCSRMRADGAVPGLMTEAEWRERMDNDDKPDIGTMLTRTFLAIDNLAVAFAKVVDRVEAMEARITALGG